MEPGTVYSFPLENGLTGTCRVIRKPEDENETDPGKSGRRTDS